MRKTTTQHADRLTVAALALVVMVGCGAEGPLMDSPPTTPSEPIARIVTITSAGVTPSPIRVTQGDRVLFVNNDTVAHEMSSDQHPTHELWPAMNQVGFLLPGESRETGNLNDVETITYHDHLDAQNPGLLGAIIIEPFE